MEWILFLLLLIVALVVVMMYLRLDEMNRDDGSDATRPGVSPDYQPAVIPERPVPESKYTVTAALRALISTPEHDENVIAAFFAPGYQQTVDGNSLDYRGFIHHMQTLKAQTTRMGISINAVVADGDTVFTHHVVDVEKPGGEKSRFEVFARFTLSSGKIIRCEELTRLMSGNPGDHDLGSRT